MSMRDRLRRLRREEPTSAQESPSAEHDSVERTEGDPGGLRAGQGPSGPWWARSTNRESSSRHGQFHLSEIEHAEGDDFALLTGDASLAELDLKRAIYLDTETTGLSGGAGTYVFMVGLGQFRGEDAGGAFECWQGFLSGPEEEAALLAECAERIRDSSGVVSFFGKSFDRHRLEDKMRLCGVEPPFEGLPHLDLYHPLRRLYRAAYTDGRLKTMERELCGVERDDDLPGSQAPAAWFDFLAKRPHQLEGVFRHNLDDVLSLVTLAAHLGRTRCETRVNRAELSGDATTRALGLSRSLNSRGDRPAACQWLETAMERGATPRRALELERADLLRLAGRHDQALEAYRTVVAGPEDSCSVPALLELAKLLEHQLRRPSDALECCRSAAILIDRNHTGATHRRLSSDLAKRRARLEGKLSAK